MSFMMWLFHHQNIYYIDMVRDDDEGTFLPKTWFNINEKCRNLIDLANGILPTCSDAEKNSEVPTPVSFSLWCIFWLVSCFVFFYLVRILIIIVLFMLLGRDCSHRQKIGQKVAATLNFHILIPCRTRCLNWGKIFDCIMILKWW